MTMNTMNRSDLIDELATRFPNLAKNDAGLVVDAILDALTDAMAAGNRIEIRGFGSFSIKQRQPRIRRNPRNGASVSVPARRVAHFKPGKALRESVDQRTMPASAGTHRAP